MATNPVDVFTYVLAELAGGAPSRFVGYSYNDTLRFRWALARTLGVAMADVDALVLGEHGDMQVPLFELVSVKGEPAGLTEQQRREVETATRTWFSTYQGLNAGRTSGWTSAMGIARLVAAMTGERTPLRAAPSRATRRRPAVRALRPTWAGFCPARPSCRANTVSRMSASGCPSSWVRAEYGRSWSCR